MAVSVPISLALPQLAEGRDDERRRQPWTTAQGRPVRLLPARECAPLPPTRFLFWFRFVIVSFRFVSFGFGLVFWRLRYLFAILATIWIGLFFLARFFDTDIGLTH